MNWIIVACLYKIMLIFSHIINSLHRIIINVETVYKKNTINQRQNMLLNSLFLFE